MRRLSGPSRRGGSPINCGARSAVAAGAPDGAVEARARAAARPVVAAFAQGQLDPIGGDAADLHGAGDRGGGRRTGPSYSTGDGAAAQADGVGGGGGGGRRARAPPPPTRKRALLGLLSALPATRQARAALAVLLCGAVALS